MNEPDRTANFKDSELETLERMKAPAQFLGPKTNRNEPVRAEYLVEKV